MRTPRIKAGKGQAGLYHCMSRVVGGAFLLGRREKEVFVRLMWRVADFLGIEVLDYAVMSNHYHQLVRVPAGVELSDPELLARLRAYYGPRSQEALEFEQAMERDAEAAGKLRAGYLKRMGDLSEFEKTLKQGFSLWYNKQRRRRGTLWMERFKSVLVEDTPEARTLLAAYIDLNPVRAELVQDPKDYRHCGYAAAMGGDPRCRRGILAVMGMQDWEQAAAAYRLLLMQRGHSQAAGKKGTVTRQALLLTLKHKGHLPRSELLRLRVRYFSDALVLGSELFVERVFAQYRSHFGEKRRSGARPIRALHDDSLRVLRDLRLNPVS